MQRKPVLIALVAVAALAAALASVYFGSATEAPGGAVATTPQGKSTSTASSTQKPGGANATPAGQTTARPGTKRTLTSAVSNPSATASLPPPGTPLKQTLAELKARADAGDATAASRLFHDMQTCAEVQHINQTMPTAAGRMLNQNPSQMSPAALQGNDRMLGMMQKNLDFAQDNAALCADLTTGDLASLVPATLQAAQLGDPQAADCYVGANLNNWPGLLDNPNWISDYKSNALPLANAAIQQGNWTMAGLLAAAYNGAGRSNMLTQVTGTDPAQAYSYLKLLSMGQQPSSNATNRINTGLTNLAGQLSPEQIQAADTWAQGTYQQYFSNAPPPTGVNNTMRACQNGGL